ncbi:hypothetical protein [Flavobacterium hydrophilum]|uniref:Uncharacterized protein n=1 Tax=Flavobacterium hydrophilum TaxID=2211445 RepID=A0A2V4C358_9FLAO|nr:hypothetical protein [Flavobacterium hydrophilum]PXY44533.1 hypothetical protein DMB68_13780 [Flavobacterium hydrophilum]
MWFKVDFDKLILLLLPTPMRKTKNFGYLKALISPILNLHIRWSNMRKDNLKKLSYNSQKCYMRGVLNDRYDPEQRRITIANTNKKPKDYIYTQAENLPVYLGTMWLEPEFNYEGSTVDFLVNVPQEIMNLKINEIVATIEFYVLAGKSYQIIAI